MTPHEALDEFGQEIVVSSRDVAVEYIEGWLNTADKPASPLAVPRIRNQHAEFVALSKLSPELKRMIRGLAVSAVDEVIHTMLLRLSDLAMEGAKLEYKGIDVLRVTPEGLHGWQLTDRGWFARWSRYGEHAHEPRDPNEPGDASSDV